ncbi:hypothetical protein KVV02_003770 [Mortierella alpina]|uniref:2-nitropropane dioxygenase n=1 Tax=Mortierella alpina TaxID=64518 RepID=A0A9P8D2Y2_MORAP|nr:hypothetical protein KVV02_003770 [Mortierella alpina]
MASTSNAFLDLFAHIRHPQAVASKPKPIVSAPMNGWAGTKLVAAVANHGGMPMFPIGYFTDPSKIIKDLQSVAPLLTHAKIHDENALDDNSSQGTTTTMKFMPYGVGFITFWLDKQGPELLLRILKGEGDLPNNHSAPRPPAAVWFSFGDYRPYLKLVRENAAPGTRVIVQVQTVQQALEAQKDKVDVIVLQGTEAGGHGAQRVSPIMTLLPEAAQALQKEVVATASSSHGEEPLAMPVLLAAGGISTPGQWKAVHAMGASGVVVGTGFMLTHEAPGSQCAKDIMIKTQDGGVSTVRTRVFDELREFDWPKSYDGRVIRNNITDREEEDQRQRGIVEPTGLGAFKLLKEDRTGTKEDWLLAQKEEDYDVLPIWCGTGVGLLKKQVSVAEFMDNLMGDA